MRPTVGLHFYFGSKNQANTKTVSHKAADSKSVKAEKTKRPVSQNDKQEGTVITSNPIIFEKPDKENN